MLDGIVCYNKSGALEALQENHVQGDIISRKQDTTIHLVKLTISPIRRKNWELWRQAAAGKIKGIGWGKKARVGGF